MSYGPDRLYQDLQTLGFKVEKVTPAAGGTFAVLPDYLVEVGKFAGRIIDLGIPATADFPRSVAAAIHVRGAPQLFDYADCVPNVRNIQPSPLGEDWRYWSKNFNWTSERSARRLVSQINSIFLHA